MDEFQFLKEEISNQKFNKRIFYAKNSNKYIDLISIDLFIDKYIPYITNYILKEENTEEVLTEYSKTFKNFLKYLGNKNILSNYLNIKNNEENLNIIKKQSNFNEAIFLILKCFFEKFFIFEDEILREESINSMKELLLQLDNYSILKNEIERYLNNMNDKNKNLDENKDINEDNEISFFFYSLLYPFIENNEQKIENYCKKLALILKNNNQLKKKSLLIQNIINILPFIKKSIDKSKINKIENNDNQINEKIIKLNKYIIKEILSLLNNIMDEKNLIISVGMNYLCEIIIIYTIKNITEIIIFYDNYKNILYCHEIDDIINNFLIKLENFINNEQNLNIPLTWRIKVSYIENICRLNKFIINLNPNYFVDYFSNLCQKILENSNNNNFNNANNDSDLKICILNHVKYFIPRLTSFVLVFKNITSLDSNIYVRSYLGIALNRILNNEQFYETYKNNNLNIVLTNIFDIIQNIIEKENFEVKYHYLSTFEFTFFNIIQNDNYKILILNKVFKLIIIAFETINEWRIRYNIYQKFEKFLLDLKNLLYIITLYEKKIDKKGPYYKNITETINNLRYLIQLFFNDKADIIRKNSLNLINNIIKMQKDSKTKEEYWLIRIKEDLIKYQFSLFNKNNNYEEFDKIINYNSILDINKNYYIKIFFLESVKKFFYLYSKEEKHVIKDIVELIKNGKKYSQENIANIKIKKDIEFILDKLTE